MEQVVRQIEDIDGLKVFLGTDETLARAAQAEEIFILLCSPGDEKEWMQSLYDEVHKAFPRAVVAGASKSVEVFGEQAAAGKTKIICSFFPASEVSSITPICRTGGTQEETRLLQFIQVVVDDLEQANKELLKLTVVDKLTQVFNRSRIEGVLQKELSRSERYGSTFSIILIDIDQFKIINDVYGHTVGDSILA